VLALAIETSHEPGSIALLRNGAVLEECRLSAGRRRGQSLVLEIQQLFTRHGLAASQTELVTVGIGPGSFTGLRVGIVAAKSIAYACGISVAGVPTLRTIVENVSEEFDRATVAIDAQRQELFLQRFRRESDGGWIAETEIEIVSFDEWCAGLSGEDVVLGPGLEPFREILNGKCRLLDDSMWMPRAGVVGELGQKPEYQQTAWDVVPLYVRKSAAEEKWEKKPAGEVGEETKSSG